MSLAFRTEAKKKTLILRILTQNTKDQYKKGFKEGCELVEDAIKEGFFTMQEVVDAARLHHKNLPISLRQTFSNGKSIEFGLDLLEFDGELTEPQYEQLRGFLFKNYGTLASRKEYYIGVVDG